MLFVIPCQSGLLFPFLWDVPVLLFANYLLIYLSPLISPREELKASESRYQAQRRVTQALQMELLQLYSRLEMEAPAATAAASSPGDAAERCCPTQTRYRYRFQFASNILFHHRCIHGIKDCIPTDLKEVLFFFLDRDL